MKNTYVKKSFCTFLMLGSKKGGWFQYFIGGLLVEISRNECWCPLGGAESLWKWSETFDMFRGDFFLLWISNKSRAAPWYVWGNSQAESIFLVELGVQYSCLWDSIRSWVYISWKEETWPSQFLFIGAELLEQWMLWQIKNQLYYCCKDSLAKEVSPILLPYLLLARLNVGYEGSKDPWAM